ncbi:DUF475 domain-containing protein [Paracoccus shanxieyensis]|uniref:DUF475 domain-containing protein n=1 Tax=Paracoccus shanxieyensis TaxID=2675752 RepID=A0A6L6IZ88_9RHOB|nr:DUF475 domain-containing protein [Paracoccus shanxieyensis]MTH64400.1 DUF475 domain-containing protein [Paracoccus shanxieyensis]MTH87607.1 DUF475 domain-containing protein [Paracoccus shanxieyensis]
MKSTIRYMTWPFIVTVIGLILAAWIGWQYSGTRSGMISFFLIAAVLAVLEISLSFDNAIVNANKLKQMTPVWQRRFLTWGIIIAVFGMRVLFPLLIVVIAASLGPIEAVRLAATQPQEYAAIIHEAHLPIAAFGGAFLMLVALNYFFDQSKDIHWIGWIEKALLKIGEIRGMEVGFVLVCMMVVLHFLPPGKEHAFIVAAVWGVITYLLVDALGHVLDQWGGGEITPGDMARGGFGAFLYLEVLDASFSFDGVIGAFALTQNLFLIAIGLGIGAMYVRSMTVMLVEKGTLAQFRYLEHGAFWSIFVLSIIMFVQTLRPIPEYITGLLGACFIGVAFLNSLAYRRRHPEEAEAHTD